MLACINPEQKDAGETNAVLEYAKVTANIVGAVTRAEVKEIKETNGRGVAATTEADKAKKEEEANNSDGDPMAGDE